MTSAWGDSWGDAWGNSWGEGAVVPVPSTPSEFVGPFGFPVFNDGIGVGVLPTLVGEGYGSVVRIGRGIAVLPLLKGDGSGRAEGAQVPRFVSDAFGVLGVQGSVRSEVPALRIESIGRSGREGRAALAIGSIRAGASGSHDPDEQAIVAFLMAA